MSVMWVLEVKDTMNRAERLLVERFGKKNGRPVLPARGRTRAPKGRMNKLEQAYSFFLEANPKVVWWKWEPLKLRLADKTFYEPDFLVQLVTGELEVHEVKGHWEDDARVKIKVAAETFPFTFVAITKKDGEWAFESIS